MNGKSLIILLFKDFSSAVLLQRTSGQNDAEYYVDDSSGQRVRKVRESLTNSANNTVEIEEKIYLAGVEIKRIRTVQGNNSTTIVDRTTLHVMDDKKRIAVVHNWSQDSNNREVNSSSDLNMNKMRYQFGNHLDSASLELDATGSIISYEEYFPYGDTSFMAGTNKNEVKLKEYRYTGKDKDDATGLYYYGARYYASWLGRWLSCDPLFREQPRVYEKPKPKDEEEKKKQDEEFKQKLFSEGLNQYFYVKGNPIRYNDPNGRESKSYFEQIISYVFFKTRVESCGVNSDSLTGAGGKIYGDTLHVASQSSKAINNIGSGNFFGIKGEAFIGENAYFQIGPLGLNAYVKGLVADTKGNTATKAGLQLYTMKNSLMPDFDSKSNRVGFEISQYYSKNSQPNYDTNLGFTADKGMFSLKNIQDIRSWEFGIGGSYGPLGASVKWSPYQLYNNITNFPNSLFQ